MMDCPSKNSSNGKFSSAVLEFTSIIYKIGQSLLSNFHG